MSLSVQELVLAVISGYPQFTMEILLVFNIFISLRFHGSLKFAEENENLIISAQIVLENRQHYIRTDFTYTIHR